MRARPALSVFAAALIAALPVHAMAQEIERNVSVRDRPRPEYDPLGAPLGGFNLHAALDLSVTAVDNIFATETAEQDDLVFAVSPRARLISDWLRHAVEIEGGARFTSYSDFSSEDAETAYLGASARLDMLRDSFVRVSGRTASEIEPRTEPDALTVGGPVEYTHQELAAEAQHTFNRFRLRGRIAAHDYNYDDVGAIDQDFRDSEELIAGLRIDAEVAPRIGLFVEAIADERDLNNAPALSSDGRTYLAGVTIAFTDLLYGEFSAGQFERSYNYGGEVEGTALAARLEWHPTQLTTVSFDANRSVEDSGATVGLPFVHNRYGVTLDHEFQRNVVFSVGVATGRNDYEVIDREDEFTTARVGIDYFVNRRVAVFGRYQFDSLDSSGADRYRDFDVSSATIGVSLRL